MLHDGDFLYFKDVGSMHLRNVGNFVPGYTTSYSEDSSILYITILCFLSQRIIGERKVLTNVQF